MISLIGYGIFKILFALLHMAWMKIYYNWLLIKLTHKKDSCLLPAQTKSKNFVNWSLTDLYTLHNPYEYLNGKTIFGIAGNVRKYGVFTQDIATSGSKSFKDGQGTNSYFFWDSFNSRICHISSSTIWNIWCKMCWLLLIIIFELQ